MMAIAHPSKIRLTKILHLVKMVTESEKMLCTCVFLPLTSESSSRRQPRRIGYAPSFFLRQLLAASRRQNYFTPHSSTLQSFSILNNFFFHILIWYRYQTFSRRDCDIRKRPQRSYHLYRLHHPFFKPFSTR